MQDTLLIVFTGILAIAVLLQTLLFFGMYKSLRQLNDRFNGWSDDVLRKIEAISSRVDEGLATIKNTAESFKPITQNLVHATQIVHSRVVELDRFIGETTRTAQLEFMHIQDTFQLTMRRAEQGIEALRDSILAPINEANAVVRAVRTGLDVLFRRRRNPSVSAQDDEMFI
jgi:CHASE1-domain containing sensor protein